MAGLVPIAPGGSDNHGGVENMASVRAEASGEKLSCTPPL